MTGSRIAIALSLGLSAVSLAWVAIHNGFPLVFQDTHHYLSLAIEGETYWARPVFYSYFLLPLHATLSPWPIVFVQGLVLAHVIALTIRVVSGSATPRVVLGVSLVLAALTSLPWYVSWIMADVFTGVVALGLFLLGFGEDRLSRGERIYVGILTAAAITFHLSHVVVSIFLATAIVFARWASGGLAKRAHRGATLPLRRVVGRVFTPPAAAISALVLAQVLDRGEVRVASHSEIFLLARFLAQEPAVDYLEASCPDASYRLCEHLDAFPMSSERFLWDRTSPLYALGGPDALRDEARRIILGSLRRFPVRHARRAAIETYRQLRRYETGDGMSPMPDDPALTRVLRDHFPGTLPAFRACRQNRGTLATRSIRPVHATTTHVALFCGLLLLGPLVRHRRWRAIGLFYVVALALVINAFACGTFSEASSRYQARVVWLVVLAPLVGCLVLAPGMWRWMSARGRTGDP